MGAEVTESAPAVRPFVQTWSIAREGICDGCSEEKWLIRAYAVDEHNEPHLCEECDALQPGSWRRQKLALDAAVKQHFDSRASVGLSKPYDEISDRSKRIVSDQLRGTVDAVVVALDGVIYEPDHDKEPQSAT